MREDYKRKALRRLQIAAGQIRGIERMINGGAYCIDIIGQSKAVREALGGFESVVLEHHLATHVIEQMRKGRQDKVRREILTVYKAARRA